MINTTSFAAHNSEEFISNLDSVLSKLQFSPTLAFSFVSVSMDIELIMNAFKKRNIKLFGTSSCGELLFDNSNEVVSDNAAVFTLTDIPTDSFDFNIHHRENLESFGFGESIGQKIKENSFPSSVLIAASGITTDGQALVEGITEIAGDDLVMFGGLAGDDSKFEKTVVFNENQISDNGAIVLLLDKNKIEIDGIASSGWIGLGADLRITKSKGNIVYTIEDKPALDVYMDYLSVEDKDLPAIGIEYPLMLKRENGEPALRAVLGIDRKDRSLIFAGSVPQDCLVTFSSSPGFDVIKSTTSKLNEFHNDNPKADFLILFSCMARHLALGPLVSQEIKFAADKWNAPVVGYFTYGEIGRNNNYCDFYNQTYTLVKITQK